MDKIGPGLPQRVDDIVNEAHLRLLDGGIMSVAHRANVHARFALLVALQEELLHEEGHPTFVERQRLGGITQIGAMHQIFKHLEAIVWN